MTSNTATMWLGSTTTSLLPPHSAMTAGLDPPHPLDPVPTPLYTSVFVDSPVSPSFSASGPFRSPVSVSAEPKQSLQSPITPYTSGNHGNGKYHQNRRRSSGGLDRVDEHDQERDHERDHEREHQSGYGYGHGQVGSGLGDIDISANQTPANMITNSNTNTNTNTMSGRTVMESGSSRAPLVARDFAAPASRSGPGAGNGIGFGLGQPNSANKSKNYPYPSRASHAHQHYQQPQQSNHSSTSFIPINDDPSDTSFTLQPPPPPSARKPLHTTSLEPLMIPPPSIHDKYLASFLDPLKPSPTSSQYRLARPGTTRSASTPAVPISTSMSGGFNVGNRQTNSRNTGLLPSPVLGASGRGHEQMHDVVDGGGDVAEPQSIFEIFNAELSQGAQGMVKALKGHLEEVLRAQEEVGRMHLELEGLGERTKSGKKENQANTGSESLGEDNASGQEEGQDGQGATQGSDGEDALLRREKGVDALMERLGSLSEKLRTYHSLGTPKLSFPSSNQSPLPPFATHAQGPSPFLSPGSAPGPASASPASRPRTRINAHAQVDEEDEGPSGTDSSIEILPHSEDLESELRPGQAGVAPSPAGLGLGSPSNFPHPLPRGVEALRRQEGYAPRHPSPVPASGSGSAPISGAATTGGGITSAGPRAGPHGMISPPQPNATSLSSVAHNKSKYRQESVNSNLSPMSLSAAEEDYNPAQSFVSLVSESQSQSHSISKKNSASFYDLAGLRRERDQKEKERERGRDRHGHGDGHGHGNSNGERDKSQERWLENLSPPPPPPPTQSQHRAGARRFDSPIEMIDRSRPW